MEAATTTTRPQPNLHTLVHFEIPASDPASVSKFYEQLFGWKFSKWGEQDYWLIAHKDALANETMGGLFKRNAPNEQFLNYISVNSVEESAAKATSLGAKSSLQSKKSQQWDTSRFSRTRTETSSPCSSL
jgi:predicted enzyme related to lactoylglutathione lyase